MAVASNTNRVIIIAEKGFSIRMAYVVVINEEVKNSLKGVHPRHSHGHEDNSEVIVIVEIQFIDVFS